MTVSGRINLQRLLGFVGIAALLTIDVYATGLFGGSERALAIVRSIVLPGLPFLEWNLLIGLATVTLALASIGAWLRWGIDWLVLAVMVTCVCVAAFVMPLHHDQRGSAERDRLESHAHSGQLDRLISPWAGVPHDLPSVIESSHEFTVVLVVFALLARLRLMFDGLPGAAWVRRALPAGWFFPAVDIARAAALGTIAAAEICSGDLEDPRLLLRARRVNLWSRCRCRGEVLRGAHALLRAALALEGSLDPQQLESFRMESRDRLAGVPDSEPTWVRPLDGMLAALALRELGENVCVQRWLDTFESRFALRHGCRPAALHTPSMLSIGAAPAWEHATATALARRAGWLNDGDWTHLRPRCLGRAASRAASGARDVQTLRLVAAGKLWAAMVHDSEAMAILGRRSIAGDRLAIALEALGNGTLPQQEH